MRALSKLEFDLLKRLDQLDKNLNPARSKILLNIQVSGGKDSMALLWALSHVLNSKQFKSREHFLFVAQHFNHQMRGEDSDQDAHFVARECLKLGIPFYLDELIYPTQKFNFQDHARKYRKEKSIQLAQSLCVELSCDRYFIVTAHHARDHVESVLMHIIRGSGLHGLCGISHFDQEMQYFRPFASVSYGDVEKYVVANKIAYREDSSNAEDKYTRNAIRHHILPLLKSLNPNYEQSFQKLSRQAATVLKEDEVTCGAPTSFLISKETTSQELFTFLKKNQKKLPISLSSNMVENILHESHLLIVKKGFSQKRIPLKAGYHVLIKKTQDSLVSLSLDDYDFRQKERAQGL